MSLSLPKFKYLLLSVVLLLSVDSHRWQPAFAAPHAKQQQLQRTTTTTPIPAAAVGTTMMTMALTLLWTASVVVVPAYAADADLQNGATLFQNNCAGCHAGGMNFMSEKKTLKKDALEQYRSLDQATLQSFVQQGMPHKLLPFSKTMSDQDYFDATSFVLDQALNDKW